MPDEVSYEVAATLPITYGSAYVGLTRKVDLKKGFVTFFYNIRCEYIRISVLDKHYNPNRTLMIQHKYT